MKDHVRSDWTGAILVCGKCSKKADDTRLAKALRKAVAARGGGGKGRRASLGVVETTCLGVCPKRGIVVVDTARPGRWEIVEPGAAAEDVLARLGRLPASNREG